MNSVHKMHHTILYHLFLDQVSLITFQMEVVEFLLHLWSHVNSLHSASLKPRCLQKAHLSAFKG